MSIYPNQQKYKGIRLGYATFPPGGNRYYRIREGRGLCYATAQGLSDEWREVYALWHRSKGDIESAQYLQWRMRSGVSA